ncbi:hypothetical protein DENSPDRAFT_64663 [Dentipellis sp. KUC8613]|nr:hypothetical protein DENSPDRAFT_64663 [Dentipellis sp. KUC8613]
MAPRKTSRSYVMASCETTFSTTPLCCVHFLFVCLFFLDVKLFREHLGCTLFLGTSAHLGETLGPVSAGVFTERCDVRSSVVEISYGLTLLLPFLSM